MQLGYVYGPWNILAGQQRAQPKHNQGLSINIRSFFPNKNTTVKVMIRSANQFYVTTDQVGNCVAVTANQFFGLARTLKRY